jgi:hypothetical protein
MARLSLFNRNLDLQPLLQKISGHQKASPKPPATDLLRLVKSGGLFLLALATGFLARELSQDQGAELYLRQHWPPTEWLESGLRSLGYQKMPPHPKRETWIKWLPVSILEAGGLAEDLPQETIVVIDRPGAEERIEVWKCASNPTFTPPKQWNHLGPGWVGALQIKKCLIKSNPKAAITGGAHRNLVDPKEIRY